MPKVSRVSNICIFSRAFYPAVGGLERIAQILAAQSAGFGHKVEVVTDTPGISDVDDQQFPFKITRTHELLCRVKAFRRADAVLFMNVSLYGMLAAIVARTPIIFSHHGIYCGRGLVGQTVELIKRQLTRFYPNIAVSGFVAANLPGKCAVIPNAYDSGLFRQPSQSVRQRDFVFCGRLVSDKGADLCVRAFAKVIREIPDASLTIIGDGPEREALLALAQELGASAHIRFAGTLGGQQLVSALQKHACMIVPSLVEEGFGISALEGIACCDTVMAFKRGGLPEAVGACGLVIEPTVAKLFLAMQDTAMARRQGAPLPGQPDEATRASHLAKHAPAIVARRYLDVIEQVLAKNK